MLGGMNTKHHKSNGDINSRKIDGNAMEGISEDGQNESIGGDS